MFGASCSVVSNSATPGTETHQAPLSSEYSGLVSFRIDWFDLLLSKELSRVFFSNTDEGINSLFE